VVTPEMPLRPARDVSVPDCVIVVPDSVNAILNHRFAN
jgi:hypothetical protein